MTPAAMTPAMMRELDIVPLTCETIARHEEIQHADVAALAKLCHPRRGLTPADAEAVFMLAAQDCPTSPEWADDFVETMSGWVVEDWAGRRIDASKADQLIAWLGGPQAHLSQPQFRLLTRVLEQTTDCSEKLLTFSRACLMRAMGIGVVRVVRAVSVA